MMLVHICVRCVSESQSLERKHKHVSSSHSSCMEGCRLEWLGLNASSLQFGAGESAAGVHGRGLSLALAPGPGAGAGASFLMLGAGAGVTVVVAAGVGPTHLQHCASPYAQPPGVSWNVCPAAHGVPGAGWPAKFEPPGQVSRQPGASPPDRPVPMSPEP